MPRLNLETLNTPGGTIETEMRKISGPEITRPEFTPVSAELMEIVSILRWNAIVILLHQFS